MNTLTFNLDQEEIAELNKFKVLCLDNKERSFIYGYDEFFIYVLGSEGWVKEENSSLVIQIVENSDFSLGGFPNKFFKYYFYEGDSCYEFTLNGTWIALIKEFCDPYGVVWVWDSGLKFWDNEWIDVELHSQCFQHQGDWFMVARNSFRLSCYFDAEKIEWVGFH